MSRLRTNVGLATANEMEHGVSRLLVSRIADCERRREPGVWSDCERGREPGVGLADSERGREHDVG